MVAFLQAYWGWIVFGALLLLMFRMHSGGHAGSQGGSCGMGHSGQMDHYKNTEDQADQPGGFTQKQPPKVSPISSEWLGEAVESTVSYNHHTPERLQEKNNGDF